MRGLTSIALLLLDETDELNQFERAVKSIAQDEYMWPRPWDS